jgi:anti-sigma factor RsiW
MNDTKFIELLNLYVDHEISAADAALLEAEIERTPARRRVYRQYCQMQKACTVLAHDFRSERSTAGADIVQFPVRRQPARTWAYATGLVAVAACIALVFVGRNRVAEPTRSNAAGNTSVRVAAQGNPALNEKTPLHASTAARPALQTVFAGITSDVGEANFAASGAESGQLEWMKGVQLQRVPVEELRFESRPEFQPDVRTYRSRQPLKGQVEMTAFKFQR